MKRALLIPLLPMLASCLDAPDEWHAYSLCRKGLTMFDRCKERFERGGSSRQERARLRNDLNEAKSYLWEGIVQYEVIAERTGWSYDTSRYKRASLAIEGLYERLSEPDVATAVP